MTIKSLINVSIDQFPRLENIYLGNEWPPHDHADHTGLDADDHLQYMTVAAGETRPHTGDLYLEADLRGVTDLRFDDSIRAAHTAGGGDWASDGIDLSASQAEWQAAYDLFGEERSILGLINGVAGLLAGVTSLNGLDGDLAIAGSDYIGVSVSDPTITISLLDHAVTHQQNGDDEINVTDLSGRLADPQYAGWFHSTAYPISTGAPSDGQSLVWSSTNSQWQPETVSTSITGLTPEQLLFGSPGGTIAQSASIYWDVSESTLELDGILAMNDNEIVGLHYIDFIANGVTADERRMWWSDDCGCLQIGMAGGTAELSMGLEMYGPRAHNTTGSTITNGTAVYLSGATAGVPSIAVADYTQGPHSLVYGIATEEIANGGLGFATTQGILRDVDTSAYTEGDPVYLGTAGAFQAAAPDAPNATTFLGWVVNSGASTGSIYVDRYKQPYLSYLSDVHARSQTHEDGQVLAWDLANLRWDLSPAVLSITHDGDTFSGLFNLYAGAGIIIDPAAGADGFILSALIADIVYNPSTITLDDGSYISGAITDMYTVNQIGYVVQETPGAPGYDMVLDFATVTESFNRLQMHIQYVATTSHTVTVQMYNYTLAQWDGLTSFGATTGWQTIDIPVANPSDYISSENARVRFYHAASGNTSHQINHDYVALVKTGGAAAGGTLDDAYDYGGAGQGREITVDAGSILFINRDDDIVSGNLALVRSDTANPTTNTASVLSISNGSSAEVPSIRFGAGQVVDNDAHGNRLWGSEGVSTTVSTAITMGITRRTGGADKASAYCKVGPYFDTPSDTGHARAMLYAESETSSDFARIEAHAQGDSAVELGWIEMEASGGIDIQATDTLTLAGSSIYCSGDNITDILSSTYGDFPYGLTSTSGVCNVDLGTHGQFQKLQMYEDVTSVVLSTPTGVGDFRIQFTAQLLNRSLSGFSSAESYSVNWIGNYDLNSDALSIPVNSAVDVKITYWGATAGFTIQVVTGVP